MTNEKTSVASSIPKDFVSKTYVMNPYTEMVIRGSQLHNGLVVLIEEGINRETPSAHTYSYLHACDEYKCPRILETSRWCEVTDLVRSGDLISFIGVYADGTQRGRTYHHSFFWLAKL